MLPSQWSTIICRKFSFSSLILAFLLLGDLGVDNSDFWGADVALGRDVVVDEEEFLEAKENPVEVEGWGADAAEVEVNEKMGLRASAFVAEFEFDANAMVANGFGFEDDSSPIAFFGACDVGIVVGCARVVEAKGLEEAAGWETGAPEDPLPLPAPNFRLTLIIFRCFITS
mmetsp:Transcript_40245/g.85705  ORF Transcript_40245/g.85705 Transcript_40245/m.85705 type:complete len:171 (-) Transcript_40245:230-742(-)